MPAIDEGLFVQINGLDQWLTIRGSDLNNPVLLIVGGPGSALSRMAPFLAPWEKYFTLVQWDQPGAGATFAKNREAGTGPLTLDRITRDGIALAELVARHLHVDNVVVLGISGGSIVGLKMVKQQPDLFAAYVGTGQFVSFARQDALGYSMVLEQARANRDHNALAELEQIGPPPYKDAATDAIKSKYAGALTTAEQAAFAALDPAVKAALKTPPADARYIAPGLEQQDVRAVSMAAYDQVRSELLAFDACELGLQFEVPMFFFQGEHDAYSVASEVQAYEARIQAPKKMLVLIPGGGHSAFFLRDEFLALLNSHVRPSLTSARSGKSRRPS